MKIICIGTISWVSPGEDGLRFPTFSVKVVRTALKQEPGLQVDN